MDRAGEYASVPLDGVWEGAPRPAPGGAAAASRPVAIDRSELDGGGIAVPLRAMPRWAPLLLLGLGTTLVGVFVWALLTVVLGPQPTGRSLGGLVLLGLFGLLGAAFLSAVPATRRAARPGRRWVLTPRSLETTSVTVPWDAIGGVRRQTLTWTTRFRTRHQHLVEVVLRPEVDPAEIGGVAESNVAGALLRHSRRRGLSLGDVRYLGVEPEPLVRALALLAGSPELRERLTDGRGVRLVETGRAD